MQAMGRVLTVSPSCSRKWPEISFSKDKWLENSPLTFDLPNFSRIANDPNPIVLQNKEGNIWNLILRRNLQDWELEEMMLP